MAKKKDGVTVAINIEVKPDNPAKMNNLTLKTLRYEVSIDMKKDPLEFLLLHGQQEVFKQVMPD